MDDVFRIDPKTLARLRIREIEEVEEILGAAIDTAYTDGRPKGKALRAIAYVIRRREDPEFTLEQAGDLWIELVEEQPDRPIGAAG